MVEYVPFSIFLNTDITVEVGTVHTSWSFKQYTFFFFIVRYLPKTINWSLLMSLFTFVPAASVFGSSWADWQRIFAHTKPNRTIEYMICIPAHTAIIGAWFGAWPMPLDWEKPWQEWPICVSYGAMVGYLVGIVASSGLALVRGRQQHHKGD
ncbi:hypothetical protein Ddye_011618 [Dipteronia dyeriana]|uniref:Phosphatidylinositol-glycan biosynthesis class F protein n=1 Tax=Dipteronia dyeriana TaxID=168575 RepID=A0AAE0CHB9_9ROSI|nr:hypothetical protein Ddye_011618 [Dipteronia dyeriana]